MSLHGSEAASFHNRPESPCVMDCDLETIARIDLPQAHWRVMVAHAKRKLEGKWIEGETPEHQAFGLLAGTPVNGAIVTSGVFPLMRNVRGHPRLGAEVAATVEALATPSSASVDRRGWLADPNEVLAIHNRCERLGAAIYGSYHMHKVSWAHDPLRDTPTPLDTALAEGQGIWMLILSMVDPSQPRLRAFFEGDLSREVAIALT